MQLLRLSIGATCNCIDWSTIQCLLFKKNLLLFSLWSDARVKIVLLWQPYCKVIHKGAMTQVMNRRFGLDNQFY